MEEEAGFEQSMADEEPETLNEHPLCCSTCETEIVPAQSASKSKKRVRNSFLSPYRFT